MGNLTNQQHATVQSAVGSLRPLIGRTNGGLKTQPRIVALCAGVMSSVWAQLGIAVTTR
jgi:hypothetical protein